MRYIILLFVICSYSCQSTTAQNIEDDIRKDQEFQELLKKVEENNRATILAQDNASKMQTQIVKQTANNIVTLKEENKDLKVELNEVKIKFDSINNDWGDSINILPISHYKKN